MTVEWLDRDGKPVTIEEWSRLKADPDYWRVGFTEVGPYAISTVWLGLDHRFSSNPDVPPIIFETMVFATGDLGTGRLPDMDCVRYATLAEAQAGHEDMVTLVRATTVDIEVPIEEPNH